MNGASPSVSPSVRAATASGSTMAISIMSLSQITYLNTSRDGAFSLRAWAMYGDIRDPEELDLMWMEAMKLLRKQNETRGLSLFYRMSKMTKEDRMAVFHKVKEDVSKSHGE